MSLKSLATSTKTQNCWRKNEMTRPNRYPYTKNQWEEETTLVCFGNDDRLELKVKRNRVTGETKQ